MTAAGWVFMIVSWGVIIGLFAFCMIRTLRSEKKGAGHPGNEEE